MTKEKLFRPFMILWGGQALSLLGSQIVQFALIWWLTEQTGSATVLATAAFVGFVPQVFLSPLIGVWVDRWNRRLILFFADLLIALATAVLLLLFRFDLVALWHIYVLLFIRSLGGAFHWPTMQATTTLMVPEQHLTRVQGMNQVLEGGMGIVAAPLGAIVVSALPMFGVLGIDLVTAVFAIAPLVFIYIPQPEEQPEAAPSSFWEDFRSGLGYVWQWKGLLYIVIMAMVINLLMVPALTLLPLLVADNFERGAYFLGFIQAMMGAGVIAGGLLVTVWGGFKQRIVTALVGLCGVAFGMMFVGVVPSLNTPNWAAVGLALLGFSLPITNAPIRAILQIAVAPEMQGRIFALIGSGTQAMAPLGLLLAGPIAERFGVPFWFLFSGAVSLVMAGAAFLSPTVMQLEQRGRAS